MDLFKKIREKSTPTVQKSIYLIASIVTTLLGLALLFVPFCLLYYGYEDVREILSLTPMSGLSYILGQWNTGDGVYVLSIALFFLWAAYALFTILRIVKMLTMLKENENELKQKAKSMCAVNTVIIAVYCLGGIVFDILNRMMNGASEKVNNLWLLIVAVVIDALFALYLGMIRQWQDKKEKKVKDEKEEALHLEKRKALLKKKLETFLYATLLTVCAMLAALGKIVDVTYVGNNTQLASYDFTIRGMDVLKNYATMEPSWQILAFLLLLVIVCVLSFYFLSIVAFISKSPAFFRFALGSILTSGVGCFIVGMYGKYYQILQSVNVQTIVTWVEYKIRSVISTNLTISAALNTLKTEFLESYEVSSSSWFYFLAAIAVIAVLLARRSYSKGLLLAKELEPSPASMMAKIERAEIEVSGLQASAPQAQDSGSFAATDTEFSLSMVDPCPAFTELDELSEGILAEVEEKKTSSLFEDPTLPKLVQFVVQYARDSRLHLFYTAEDIATFIAGLGTTKLSILQGMSGTGKTSLPKIFSEALFSNCEIIEVESSWRDKNELLGYYNEFSKAYTPKKFTQALYKAVLNPETLTFIVLDEMNLSRIEYYFSDFLSLMENEPDKREIKLLNVGLFKKFGGQKHPYKGLTRGHTIKIPQNVWFIGTANRDESTFEISDKVYDRAHTINFNKRAKKIHSYGEPLSPKFLTAERFNALLEEGRTAVNFNVENDPVIAEVEKLLAPYNISFGNRIAMQIERFVSIYCACFTPSEEVIRDAVERILLTKVVCKLELKSVDNKEELAAAFEGLGLLRCSEFISKLNED